MSAIRNTHIKRLYIINTFLLPSSERDVNQYVLISYQLISKRLKVYVTN
jgi:hypothetical protein